MRTTDTRMDSVHSDLYEYSKFVDENREKFEGLPYPAAFEALVGPDTEPEERPDGQEAIWQRIEGDKDIPEGRGRWLRTVIEEYPLDRLEDLRDRSEKQEVFAHLLDDVSFRNGDYQYVTDLVHAAIYEDEPLSASEEKWLRYYVDKYREQIQVNVADLGIVDPEIEDQFDDPFEFLSDIFEECEGFYHDAD